MFNARVACPNGFGLNKSSFALATKPTEALKRYPIILREDYYALQSPSGADFAVLDIAATRTLRLLQSVGRVRFQAVFQCNVINGPAMTGSTGVKRNTTGVSINIYGIHNLANKVGSTLTREQQFLQHPDVVDPGINYDNPQYFKMPGLTLDLNQSVKPRHPGQKSKEAISSEVNKVMDSLDVVDSDLDTPDISGILTSLLR